ncbi:type 4a pilus biogenesis protein PilO [Pilimelia columellifera]
MKRSTTDRVWLAGGALGAVALIALSWLLLIGPAVTEVSSLREQAEQSELELVRQQRRLIELRAASADAARYQQELARARLALPTDAGMPDFITELQRAGADTRVSVTNVSVAAPIPMTGQSPAVFALPVTLTVTGRQQQTEAFVARVQDTMDRAVLIGNVSTSTDDNKLVTMTLTMQAYVGAAPAAAK